MNHRSEEVARQHWLHRGASKASSGAARHDNIRDLRLRITRYRPGASRFTLIDPSGNSIMFIQRDEPAELEYGGSKKLTGLTRALDDARILREFKNDDLQAFRALKPAVRRHGAAAPVVERAIAPCRLIDLAMVLGEPTDPWGADLRDLELSTGDRQRIESELGHLAGLQERLPRNRTSNGSPTLGPDGRSKGDPHRWGARVVDTAPSSRPRSS